MAKVDPTLAFIDSKGEMTGVKYEKMSMLLINAVKEQQTQIEVQEKQNNAQQRQIEQQRTEIDALRALVCRRNRNVAICRAAR